MLTKKANHYDEKSSSPPDAVCALTPPPSARPPEWVGQVGDARIDASAVPNTSEMADTVMAGKSKGPQPYEQVKLTRETEHLLHDKLLKSAGRIYYKDQPVPSLGGIPLLAQLGQGGMGAVYYGIHPRLNVEVAVKLLPSDMTVDREELIDRFRREAQIAARVKSMHLVGVVDINNENDLDYLVMEYVGGPSADKFLRGQYPEGMNERDALRIIRAASRGLGDAHAAGIVHRDIKPANILLPQSADEPYPRFDESKLADLGIARIEGQSQALTCASAALGTFGYMSPEQARDAHAAGKTADVFSMGATLYALLCGRTPFRKTTLIEMFQATLDCRYEPIRDLHTDITPATEELIERCLCKEPASRPADGLELTQEIERCLNALGQDTADFETVVRSGPPESRGNTPIELEKPAPPPMKQAMPEKADTPRHAPEEKEEVEIPSIQVLVIDDDSVARVMLKRMLGRLPWEIDVFAAASVEEAQGHIQGITPDIIVTDVCMNDADGFELIEWARSFDHLALTPVVVVSSIPETVGKRRCLMVGADAYLQKPVSREKLEKVVGRMVGRLGR